jgi:hypothetical protein
MGKKLIEILEELTVLEKSTTEDYNNKRYSAYEQYIKEFNRILKELNELGYFIDTKQINYVPDSKKAYMGVGSDAEIAKLREIADETKKLVAKLRLKRGVRIWISYDEKMIKINKNLLWVIIPIFLSIIGGTFILGKEFGNYRYDKEKNDLETQNVRLKLRFDSLQNEFTATYKKYQDIFMLFESNKKTLNKQTN